MQIFRLTLKFSIFYVKMYLVIEMSKKTTIIKNHSYLIKNNYLIARKKYLDTSFHMHGHDYFEIEITVNGSGFEVLNGKDVPLRKGSVRLLTPADIHSLNTYEPMTLYNIEFTEDVLENTVDYSILKHIQKCDLTLTDEQLSEVLPYLDSLTNESSKNDENSARFIKCMFECLIIALLRATKESIVITSAGGNIDNAINYIRRHFREECSLSEVASAAGLNPNYLSEKIKATTGYKFTDYVAIHRIRYAKNLLISTDIPITEICYLSGFGSFSNFSRAFLKSTGKTPSKYREKKILTSK